MTDYSRAKDEAIRDLVQRGRACGYDPQVIDNTKLIRDGDRIVARVRATRQQGRAPKFDVDDEVDAELPGISSAYTVVLKLRGGEGWNPKTDHFYPIRISTIKRDARQAGATQQIRIELSEYSHCRDDISRLFPDSDGDEGGDYTVSETADNDRSVGPDWSTATPEQQELRKIAQDFES